MLADEVHGADVPLQFWRVICERAALTACAVLVGIPKGVRVVGCWDETRFVISAPTCEQQGGVDAQMTRRVGAEVPVLRGVWARGVGALWVWVGGCGKNEDGVPDLCRKDTEERG